jgi:hypothetical protein
MNISSSANHSQGLPQICAPTGQANNLLPPQTDILWRFSAYDRAGEHFLGRVSKLCIILGEILSRVDNLSLLAPYSRLSQRSLRTPGR